MEVNSVFVAQTPVEAIIMVYVNNVPNFRGSKFKTLLLQFCTLHPLI